MQAAALLRLLRASRAARLLQIISTMPLLLGFSEYSSAQTTIQQPPVSRQGGQWMMIAAPVQATIISTKLADRIATPRPTGACALPAPPRPCRQRRARPSRTANAIRATRGLTEGHARLAQMDISRVSMALLVVRSALKGSSQRASVRRRMLRAALVS